MLHATTPEGGDLNVYPSFLDRAFAQVIPPAAVAFKVGRYSWRDIGGPAQAQISATGNEAALWGLTGWLRYGVELLDETGDAVWWGYINSVTIEVGAVSVTYSLGNMVNRVRVVYQLRNADGTVERAVTADADDALSQSYFGAVKERAVRGGDLSANAAIALRDETLARFKYFGAELEVRGNKTETPKVSIECLGYWQTLSWRLVSVANGDQAQTQENQYGPYGFNVTYFPWGYTNGAKGDGWMRLGEYPSASDVATIAQSFTLPTSGSTQPVYIENIQAMLKRNSTGSGNLTMAVYSDNSGSPGTLIYTMKTVAASKCNNADYDWVSFQADNSYSWLLPGTKYWAVLSRGQSYVGDGIEWVGVTDNPDTNSQRTKQQLTAGGAWTTCSSNIAQGDVNLQVNVSHRESRLHLGANTSQTKIRQGFYCYRSNSTISAIKLRCFKAGNVSDNVVVKVIAADGTTVLDTATFAASGLPNEFDWYTFTMNNTAALASGSTFYIELSRSGSVSANGFTAFAASLAKPYTLGNTQVWNGSAWGTPTPDVQLLFEILTVQETTQQASSIIGDYGPLLGPVTISTASGIYGSPTRDGETDALQEIVSLLEAGTTNNRRELAKVLRNRSVLLYEAPAATATAYVNRAGELVDAAGIDVRMQTCPVGLWIGPFDITPAGASFAPLGASDVFYVEEAEVEPERGVWRPRLRGQRDPFDLGGIRL